MGSVRQPPSVDARTSAFSQAWNRLPEFRVSRCRRSRQPGRPHIVDAPTPTPGLDRTMWGRPPPRLFDLELMRLGDRSPATPFASIHARHHRPDCVKPHKFLALSAGFIKLVRHPGFTRPRHKVCMEMGWNIVHVQHRMNTADNLRSGGLCKCRRAAAFVPPGDASAVVQLPISDRLYGTAFCFMIHRPW